MYIALAYVRNGTIGYQGPHGMESNGSHYYMQEAPQTHFSAPGWYDLPVFDNDDGVSQIVAYVHPDAKVSLAYIEGYSYGWTVAAKAMAKPALVPSLN